MLKVSYVDECGPAVAPSWDVSAQNLAMGQLGGVHTGGNPSSRAVPARTCRGPGAEGRRMSAGRFGIYLKREGLGCPPIARDKRSLRHRRGRARRRCGVWRASAGRRGDRRRGAAGCSCVRGVVVEGGETKKSDTRGQPLL